MPENLDGTAIARRMLRFVTHEGVHHDVVVSLGPVGPGLSPEESRCVYRIVGPTITVTNYATGVDGIQAIQLAIAMIETELEVRLMSRGGKLLWGDGSVYRKPDFP